MVVFKSIRACFLCLVLSLLLIGCSSTDGHYDLVIRSGRIVNGTGRRPYRADIGIRDGTIVKIGRISADAGDKVLDATGLIVAPGFIDVHTHTDRRIDTHPEAANYLLQGVTTVVGGNCGGSRFPLTELFDRVEENGIALNFATFVGHNTVRRRVMGNEARAPSEEELEKMKALVDQEMKAGAIGLSTGLEYLPGRFSETEEVVDLARMIAPYDGVYATHLRDQGKFIQGAIEEAVRVGQEAGVTVQVSHIKLKLEKSWGQRQMITDPIEAAHRDGMKVYMDEYPYMAGSTGFTSSFPEWAVAGGHGAFVERLKNPDMVQQMKDHLIDLRFMSSRGIDKAAMITITRDRRRPEYEGKTLADILALRGLENTPSNTADLFIELERDDRPGALFHQADEADVVALMQEPYCMVASDGGIQVFRQGVTHPRNYGTFPRVLARFVLEKGVLSLRDAIRKMTSLPAEAMGFKDRGMLRKGMAADVVVFDLESISDEATYEEPHQYPAGIRWVIVNGSVAVREREVVSRDSGKVLYGRGKEVGIDL